MCVFVSFAEFGEINAKEQYTLKKHAFAEPCLEHIGVIDINSAYGERHTSRQLNKVGTLGFFLALPRQHFNLLNICDKAQPGHLLRDRTQAITLMLILRAQIRHVLYTTTALCHITYYCQLQSFICLFVSKCLLELVHNI